MLLKLKSVLILGCLLISCGQNDKTQDFSPPTPPTTSKSAININTANAETLKTLPNIGAKTAREIINHREKFGRFRKPEHLLLVRGISDRRFREIRNLIKTE
jgi:competence ComEA-like helix-hairpin-helix protein